MSRAWVFTALAYALAPITVFLVFFSLDSFGKGAPEPRGVFAGWASLVTLVLQLLSGVTAVVLAAISPRSPRGELLALVVAAGAIALGIVITLFGWILLCAGRSRMPYCIWN